MKKVKILIAVTLLLMLSTIAGPVMAIGPEQAAKVGNNPNLTYLVGPAGADLTFLETPPDISTLWINRETQSDVAFLFYNAEIGQGKMNNAIVASSANLQSIMNPAGHWNEWIYLSGGSGGETMNGHSMLYWVLRGLGFSQDTALQDEIDHPYGVFLLKLSPGQ